MRNQPERNHGLKKLLMCSDLRARANIGPLGTKDYSSVIFEKLRFLQISVAILNFSGNEKCCLSITERDILGKHWPHWTTPLIPVNNLEFS